MNAAIRSALLTIVALAGLMAFAPDLQAQRRVTPVQPERNGL